MAEIVTGWPAPLPFGIDFVTYSNEDLGRTAAYSAGNDVQQVPMPYPSSMNLWEETFILFAIEFIHHNNDQAKTSLIFAGETVHLSMLGDDFGDNWASVLVDAEDETWKAQFAGPFYVGELWRSLTATASVEGIQRRQDVNQSVLYYPPEPLDLVTPLYINYTNASTNHTLATNVVSQDDDANFTEQVTVRAWFLKRDYTPQEKAFLNRLPTRFQQLDS